MMPLVTICCSAETSELGSGGMWSVASERECVCLYEPGSAGGRCSRSSTRLVPLVDESQLHPKAAPPVMQQLRPANAALGPQATLV